MNSALAEMTVTFFVEDGLRLQQPNGTFFVQFWKASLNTEIISNHFIYAGDMKDWMNLGVARELQFVSHWPKTFEEYLIGAIKLGINILAVVVLE